MKIFAALLLLCSLTPVQAEPVKCVVNGKTIYSDDPAVCGNNTIKPVKGNVSTFPKPEPLAKNPPAAAPNAVIPAATGDLSGQHPLDLLQRLGIAPQDITNGWQVIMDAKQRGSWQAPAMPEEPR